MKHFFGLFLMLVFLSSLNGQVQVSGFNLLEYQHGKLPNDTVSFSTLYDRAKVAVDWNYFRASVSLEQFHTPYDNRNYMQLTQYTLRFIRDSLDVTLGNFYETLGRGSLLRSFENPGAILEDFGYRSRHYFHRDIQGARVSYTWKNIDLKALYGRPLNYVFPPGEPEKNRRSDIVEAAYLQYRIAKQVLGVSALQLNNASGSNTYAMFSAGGKIATPLAYYTECVKNISGNNPVQFSSTASYAVYGGISYTPGAFSISAEYKNYRNILLGAGINEPPALIREHSYKTLNRSTHVLQPLNETGYQVEAYYYFADASVLTVNHALAVNTFGNRYVFKEYFVEYNFALLSKHDTRLFFDVAQDPFKQEENRVSAGTYMEWAIARKHSVKTDYEFQQFKRNGVLVINQVYALTWLHTSKLACGVVAEYTTDPFLTTQAFKTWKGVQLKYQLGSSHTLQLFAGERRGGPACNAGVCYEVPDFEGFEFRLTSRI